MAPPVWSAMARPPADRAAQRPAQPAASPGRPAAAQSDRSLRITLTAHTDGNVVLQCERDDGSATWQRQQGRHARFFPLHDLTHYAVETRLGFRQGFFGLIAAGWDIEDTTGKGRRGPLPRNRARRAPGGPLHRGTRGRQRVERRRLQRPAARHMHAHRTGHPPAGRSTAGRRACLHARIAPALGRSAGRVRARAAVSSRSRQPLTGRGPPLRFVRARRFAGRALMAPPAPTFFVVGAPKAGTTRSITTSISIRPCT